MKKIFAVMLSIILLTSAAFADDGSSAEPLMTHRMMMLVIQLGVILLCAKIGNILFEKIKLPGVLGELSVGVIMGPYLLGSIPLPGFPSGLFPEAGSFPVSPELYGLCSVAAVVLLFMVGLETDIGLFVKYSLAGTFVGIGGVLASFLTGDLLAVFFSKKLFGYQLDFFSPACVFLGIMSTATSVGITARILSEKRKLDSPEGVTILAGAVIDDVLGIVLLAVGLGVISASKNSGSVDWMHVGIIAAKAVGIWLVATVAGLLASRKISLLLKLFRDHSSIAVMALGLALILSGLFEEAGLAMIIGAYVMGLSLARADINHVVREKLHPIYALLVPVFFTVMGMLVNVKALVSPAVLAFGIIFTITAILAKMVGCGLPSMFFGFNTRGALRVGFGMVPRGEVALIVAGIGLAAGLLDQQVFGVGIFMTLISTMIAPPVLVRLFKGKESGLRSPSSMSEETPVSFTLPSAEAAELLVSSTVRTFKREGFFAHSLSQSENLYQLRKDSVVITFRQQDNQVEFDCDPSHTALVSTAVMDVLADMERMVSELKKPVDKRAIGQTFQNSSGNGTKGLLDLSRLISPELLVPELSATTKEGIIDELLEVINRASLLNDIEKARKAVWTREKSMSTGMQHGIAIPHGRTDAVSGLVCAVGLKPAGIDFESMDGKPSAIFVLTLSPEGAAAPHVQFMSAISQILNGEGRSRLLTARTSADMYSILTGKDTKAQSFRNRQGFFSRIRVKQIPVVFRKHLKVNNIKPDLTAADRDGVIDELLALLAGNGEVADVKTARADILSREIKMSTCLKGGLAIPHARTSAVKKFTCAIGVKRDGLDFGAPNNELTNVFVMTLAPRDKSAPHVRFMALLMRVLNEKVVKSIIAENTADGIMKILERESGDGSRAE